MMDENPHRAPQEKPQPKGRPGWPAARTWFVLLAFPFFGYVMVVVATPADPVSFRIGLTAAMIVAAIADAMFLLVLWLTR